jgi:hypothetical protein
VVARVRFDDDIRDIATIDDNRVDDDNDDDDDGDGDDDDDDERDAATIWLLCDDEITEPFCMLLFMWLLLYNGLDIPL